MIHEATRAAERDIRDILRETLKRFGTHQLDVYSRIIDHGMALVGNDPERLGSLDRSEIAPGVRLFHLEHAAGRSGGASHCLYYSVGRLSDGAMGIIILRVLHEHMEPRHKVVRSLKSHGSQAAPTSDTCD